MLGKQQPGTGFPNGIFVSLVKPTIVPLENSSSHIDRTVFTNLREKNIVNNVIHVILIKIRYWKSGNPGHSGRKWWEPSLTGGH